MTEIDEKRIKEILKMAGMTEMTEADEREYREIFKKEGVKACIKKAKANKNPKEIEFCEDLYLGVEFK